MYFMDNSLKTCCSFFLQDIAVPSFHWSSISSELIVCSNLAWGDSTPSSSSVETQFGADHTDSMQGREWANTNQIPQTFTNLHISFFSCGHQVKLQPCLY